MKFLETPKMLMRSEKTIFSSVVLFLCMISFYSSNVYSEELLDPNNAFSPPWNHTLLFIGQDKRTIDRYVKDFKMEPGGVMVYTAIQHLRGLDKPFRSGAGTHYADYVLEKYPDSVLQLGLYMVGALLEINSGFYDPNIDKLADWVKSKKRPVYLRIGYEFDNADNNYDQTQYIYAFQRIVDRFRAKGVDNVAFVWHSDGQIRSDDPLSWYPGDDYVDWIGVSFFSTSQYEQAIHMYGIAYRKLKPFMIAEASPFGMVTLEGKTDWYERFFQLIDETLPSAVCYINSNWDILPMYMKSNYGDARVQMIPEIKEMWLKEIEDSKYIHAWQLGGKPNPFDVAREEAKKKAEEEKKKKKRRRKKAVGIAF